MEPRAQALPKAAESRHFPTFGQWVPVRQGTPPSNEERTMRVQTLAVQLGLFASAAMFAACGGGESEPANETPAQPSGGAAGAPAAGGAATPVAANLPAGVTQDMVAQGQQIFNGQGGICFTCHGQNGQGSPLAPNLADDEWLWITPGPDMYDQIVNNVKTGVQQPKEHPAPMPPMGGSQLSEDQVRAVAAYVYALAGAQGG